MFLASTEDSIAWCRTDYPLLLAGGDLLGYPARNQVRPNVAVNAVTQNLRVASPQPVNGKFALAGSCVATIPSFR